MEDCDAAIIMVDLADPANMEHAVSWYSKFPLFFLLLAFFSQLIPYHIEEIISSRQHSQDPASLPIAIFSWKAYEESDKWTIDPPELPWPNGFGDIPFFHTTHLDLKEKANRIKSDEDDRRPIGWILEQLTGAVNVVCLFLILLTPQHFP